MPPAVTSTLSGGRAPSLAYAAVYVIRQLFLRAAAVYERNSRHGPAPGHRGGGDWRRLIIALTAAVIHVCLHCRFAGACTSGQTHVSGWRSFLAKSGPALPARRRFPASGTAGHFSPALSRRLPAKISGAGRRRRSPDLKSRRAAEIDLPLTLILHVGRRYGSLLEIDHRAWSPPVILGRRPRHIVECGWALPARWSGWLISCLSLSHARLPAVARHRHRRRRRALALTGGAMIQGQLGELADTYFWRSITITSAYLAGAGFKRLMESDFRRVRQGARVAPILCRRRTAMRYGDGDCRFDDYAPRE